MKDQARENCWEVTLAAATCPNEHPTLLVSAWRSILFLACEGLGFFTTSQEYCCPFPSSEISFQLQQ